MAGLSVNVNAEVSLNAEVSRNAEVNRNANDSLSVPSPR